MIPNQICLEDSESIMNDHQLQLFLNVHKSKSDDSVLGKFIFTGKEQTQKRQLLLDFNQPSKQINNIKVFKKKTRKQRKKNFCDYRKNICGYITKKIIRQYISPTFSGFVTQLCQKHGCSYSRSKSYYLGKIERVTGPSHVPDLLIASKQQQIPVKRAFKEFFTWFLKERYLRYLMLQGKMENKKAYIEYKNHNLMMIYEQSEDNFFQESDSKIKRKCQTLFQSDMSQFSKGFEI